MAAGVQFCVCELQFIRVRWFEWGVTATNTYCVFCGIFPFNLWKDNQVFICLFIYILISLFQSKPFCLWFEEGKTYSVCAVKQNMICWICHLISLQKLCKNGFVHVKVFNIKGTRHEVFKNFISKDKEINIWACILTCLKFVSNCESAV